MSNNYRVCSWDVGIKNLAYCIIEKNDDDFKIIKWDIINIIDSDKITCCSPLKKNSKKGVIIVCGKNASFYGFENDIKKYYCGTHKKNYKPLDDDWESNFMIEFNNTDKTKCSYILPKKKEQCPKNAKYKVLNNDLSSDKFYCTTHGNGAVNKIKKEFQIKKIKKKKATSINSQILGKSMYSKLDMVKEMIYVDDVLIENQPALKNPSMKTVACLLFGYFIIRGINDKHINKSTIERVKFISPSNKLKVNSYQIDKILQKIDENDKVYKIIIKLTMKYFNIEYNHKKIEKDINKLLEYVPINFQKQFVHLITRYLMDKKNVLKNIDSYNLFESIEISKDKFLDLLKKIEKDDNIYNITKSLAIKYTEVLLKNKKSWLVHMDKYKKKDDICDAFLQGYHFMFLK